MLLLLSSCISSTLRLGLLSTVLKAASVRRLFVHLDLCSDWHAWKQSPSIQTGGSINCTSNRGFRLEIHRVLVWFWDSQYNVWNLHFPTKSPYSYFFYRPKPIEFKMEMSKSHLNFQYSSPEIRSGITYSRLELKCFRVIIWRDRGTSSRQTFNSFRFVCFHLYWPFTDFWNYRIGFTFCGILPVC